MDTLEPQHSVAAPSSAAVRRSVWTPAIWIIPAWLLLIASAALIEHLSGRPVPTCIFKRITGYPCVGCGSTRGVLTAFRGDMPGAFAYNPLVLSALAIGPIWLGTYMWTERRRVHQGRARVYWSSSQRAIAWIAGTALVTANWAYVLWRGN